MRVARYRGLIGYIAKHEAGARVRPEMKVVFFDEWEKPSARLKGNAGILRIAGTISLIRRCERSGSRRRLGQLVHRA
jgi:hypothetical protein